MGRKRKKTFAVMAASHVVQTKKVRQRLNSQRKPCPQSKFIEDVVQKGWVGLDDNTPSLLCLICNRA